MIDLLGVIHRRPPGGSTAGPGGHEQDRTDVRHLIDSGLVDPDLLRELFELAAHDLVKYPAIDEATLRARLRGVT